MWPRSPSGDDDSELHTGQTYFMLRCIWLCMRNLATVRKHCEQSGHFTLASSCIILCALIDVFANTFPH